MQALATLVAVLGCVVISNAQYYEANDLMDDLYKRLAQLDSQYYLDEPWESDDIQLDDRAADIRDPEFLQHGAGNNVDGFQYISGGAGEGLQHLTPEGTQNNTQEVKSDEGLPFYCHPPNPCPKGKTADDGCQDFVQDAAEAQRDWIDGLMQRELCSCDEEHMFSCPKDMGTMNSDKGHESRNELDKVLDSLLNNADESDNPYMGGSKRDSLMAKKMLEDRRAYDDAVMSFEENPYLGGDRLPIAAKKGMQWKNM